MWKPPIPIFMLIPMSMPFFILPILIMPLTIPMLSPVPLRLSVPLPVPLQCEYLEKGWVNMKGSDNPTQAQCWSAYSEQSRYVYIWCPSMVPYINTIRTGYFLSCDYNCYNLISIQYVFLQFKSTLFHVFFLSRVTMNSINWSSPNIWVSIARLTLVEHCRASAESMSSNPVEDPINFFWA